MNIVANTIVPLCFSCSKGITWCVSLVFVSQTSWCLAGSAYKMFHPRHSMDLWQDSTQHRPSHTHCSGEGEPGQCRCLNPDKVVAVRTQSGGTYFKRGFQDCVRTFTCLHHPFLFNFSSNVAVLLQHTVQFG